MIPSVNIQVSPNRALAALHLGGLSWSIVKFPSQSWIFWILNMILEFYFLNIDYWMKY